MLPCFRYDVVDSTNDEAMRLARTGAIAGRAVVVAREQSAGRGRFGRRWQSPRDAGVYLSFVRVGDGPVDNLTMHTLAAGIACVRAIHAVTRINVRIKPINDLYAEGRKLGGILAESVVESDKIVALVIGVGINLLPMEVAETDSTPSCPISLSEIVERPRIDDALIERLVAVVARKLSAWSRMVARGRVSMIERIWREMCIDPA